jgi:transposase
MCASEHLSIEQRWAAVSLHNYADWTEEKIAKKLNASRTAISQLITKYRSTNTVEDLPRSGRPQLIDITNKNNNPISNIITKKRKATSKEIRDELKIQISWQTICRLRKQLGYRPVHFRKVPKFNEQTKHKRYEYCLDNMDEDWKNIIFTDETWFVLCDSKEVIWKRPEEEPIQNKTLKYPEKVMIWGGVWWNGKTDICFVDTTMDRWVYIDVLKKYLVEPHLTVHHEVLQDGAKPHTADDTWEFIDEQGIDMRQNPPNSPELNPIEKVWGWMKNEINKHTITSMGELKELVNKYWNEIPQTTIQQFISHNKTVVNEIVVAGGDTIADKTGYHKREAG